MSVVPSAKFNRLRVGAQPVLDAGCSVVGRLTLDGCMVSGQLGGTRAKRLVCMDQSGEGRRGRRSWLNRSRRGRGKVERCNWSCNVVAEIETGREMK